MSKKNLILGQESIDIELSKSDEYFILIQKNNGDIQEQRIFISVETIKKFSDNLAKLVESF